MRKLPVLLVFPALLFAGPSSAGTAQLTIAVLDFQAVNTATGDAVVMAGFVRSAIVKSGFFTVVERQTMERVLAEQALQQTGCTDQECIVRLGKVLNAKKVIAGSLSLLAGDRFLSIRMVDVETGRIDQEEASEAFQLKDAKRVADEIVNRFLAHGPPGVVSAPGVRRAGTGNTFTSRDGAVMAMVPAGTFTMGSRDGEADERPAHRVAVNAFYLDTCEVTNTAYAAFLNEFGRDTDVDGQRMVYECDWGVRRVNGRWEAQPGYELNPVVAVTWHGAAGYARYWGKRLPTEAEWEYACRAGAVGKWCFGDEADRLAEYAWYRENSDETTHPVGSKSANQFGLKDMNGNAWEWVADWFAPYAKDAATDPTGPASGEFRILRGGSWRYSASWSRSAFRYRVLPGLRNSYGGFRCAMSLETSPAAPAAAH